jgi:hypothetical protein
VVQLRKPEADSWDLILLWDILSEIDKRKVFFLGMLINSSRTQVYKVMFYRQLISWKWDFKSVMTD